MKHRSRLFSTLTIFNWPLLMLMVLPIVKSLAADPCCVWIPGGSLSAGPGGGGVSLNVTVSINGTNCPSSSGGAAVGPGSASGDFSVMTSSNVCAWTAASDVGWINITAGSSGTGTGVVSFVVDANTNCAARSGTLTIAGHAFPMTQAALAISPGSAAVAAGGGTNTVAVSAVSGCSWTAAPSAGWLHLLSGSTGTGNGTVGYTVDPNASGSARSGILTIAGQTFTVNQSAVAIAPSAVSLGAAGSSGTVEVTGLWSNLTASNAGWIRITTVIIGHGSGSVGYTVDSNTTCVARAGTLTIAGQTFTVNQDAGLGSYTLSAAATALGATGGSGTVTVTTGTGCGWTAASNIAWLHISSGASSTGNGTVGYTVDTNTTCVARAGTLTIAGQTFTVNQDAGLGSYTLSAAATALGATGGSGTVTVTTGTGCGWTAASNIAWLHLSSGASSAGNGTVGYTVDTNTTCVARAGTLTIAGQTFTVNQDAGTGVFSISPTNTNVGTAGGSSNVSVSATSTCSWNADSNSDWIKLTGNASGSGVGMVTFSVDPNTAVDSRVGILSIAGQTFTVTQMGCIYALSATGETFGATGGTNTISIVTTAPCPWTATTSTAWLTILGSASGAGSGAVTYAVAPNATSSMRTGTVSIANQTHTVTQAENAPPLVNLAPVTPVIWPAASVNLRATVTDDGAPFRTLNLNWSQVGGTGTVLFADATASNTVATCSAPGSYQLRLTATDGAIPVSQDVTVLVAQRPQITTTLVTTNALAQIGNETILPAGEAVGFTVGVVDPDGRGVHCTWDFGDGTTSPDCAPTHVFTNCGPHPVTVLIDDGLATSTTSAVMTVACAFDITKLQASVNFVTTNADSCTVKGLLDLPPDHNFAGQALTLDIAGAWASFPLDSRGRHGGLSTFTTPTYNKKIGRWTVNATLNKGSWQSVWAEFGLTNSTIARPGVLVTNLPVILVLDTEAFMGTTNLHYTATHSRSGTAK